MVKNVDGSPKLGRALAQVLSLVWVVLSAVAAAEAGAAILAHRHLDHGFYYSAFAVVDKALLEGLERTLWTTPIAVLLAVWLARWCRATGIEAAGRMGSPLLLVMTVGAAWGCAEVSLRWAWHDVLFLPRAARVSVITAAALALLLLALWLFRRLRIAFRLSLAGFLSGRTVSWLGVVSVALTAVLAVGVRVIDHPDRSAGPNVIFIVIDTLRTDHMGAWGYERPTTPALDHLAEHAHRFDQAIATAPWTPASVAGMLSSRFPRELGYEGEAVELPRSLSLLAESFREHHYRTGAVISNPMLSRTGFDQGFQLYDEENSLGHDHISAPSVTQKAEDFVQRNHDVPFFLFLHYMDPHYHYYLHPRWNFGGDYSGVVESSQDWAALLELGPSLSLSDLDQLRALYDSEIRFTDFYLAKFFETLRKLDLYDETLIVVVSDHGEEFADRGTGKLGHGHSLYRELLHVPLLIKLPGQAAGEVHHEPVSLVDLAPTILETVGLSEPRNAVRRGRSLWHGTQGRVVISELPGDEGLEAVRKDGWKLIRNWKNGEIQLFDLVHDPDERNDLAAQETARAEGLIALLDRFNSTVNANESTVARSADFSPEQERQLRSLGYLD